MSTVKLVSIDVHTVIVSVIEVSISVRRTLLRIRYAPETRAAIIACATRACTRLRGYRYESDSDSINNNLYCVWRENEY